MTVSTAHDPVLLDARMIDAAEWEPLDAIGRGVSHKVLWRSGDSLSGVMRLEVGGHVEEHAHRQAHHHLWVLEGTVEVLGTPLSSGSYAHVPAGVVHSMVNHADRPSTFLYLYLQPA